MTVRRFLSSVVLRFFKKIIIRILEPQINTDKHGYFIALEYVIQILYKKFKKMKKFCAKVLTYTTWCRIFFSSDTTLCRKLNERPMNNSYLFLRMSFRRARSPD